MPGRSISQDCAKVKIADFPKKDLPSATERDHFKNEESSKYYYGIGVPVDYVKARFIALIEMEKDDGRENPFGGAAILMMLYANGFGVKRDIDLSIRLACANVGHAPAEIDGRIRHLQHIKAGDAEGVFDICDDITSGYMDGMCQFIHSRLAEIKRKSTIDSVIKNWQEQDKRAYEQLRKSATAFFDQRVLSEVDMTGTSRAAIALAEGDLLEDSFKENILKAGKCILPCYNTTDFIKADNELNLIYKKIMADKGLNWGTVTKDGIRSTQRKWILYRDAWVTFGTMHCPSVSDVTWKTIITLARILQLKDFVAG